MLDDKVILVTGGTGSFGQHFVGTVLERYKPKRLIIFSRDELKQSEMSRRFPHEKYNCIRYFIGDVRDRERLYRAFDGVDVVVHAAALKQVPSCEYNPFEAVKTNILGAANIIDAAIDRDIEHVVALSTDKAANPVNLYGATKLCADKLFTAAKSYSGDRETQFCVVRYGNVLGSRGSVVPYFIKQRESGEVTVTDERMTRFWITLDQAVDFVLASLSRMKGNEVFVPKIPSMKIIEMAKILAPNAKVKVNGIRPGEKLHEVMVTKEDGQYAREYDGYFTIYPTIQEVDLQYKGGGKPCKEGFQYDSESNDWWLSNDELAKLLDKMGMVEA